MQTSDKKPEVKKRKLDEHVMLPSGKRPRKNKIIRAVDYLKAKYDFRSNRISLIYEMRRKGQIDYEKFNEDLLFVELQSNFIAVSVSNIVSIIKGGLLVEYDPIAEYFDCLPKWDGSTDHIEKLASYVNAVDYKSFEYHFKKHLVRTVRCALDDYYFNKQAFIIQDIKQNSGKTTFIRNLCPKTLSSYIAENIGIDKDSRILLAKNFMINVDELDTLNKVSIDGLKAMLTKDKINDRLPFERTNSVIPRRASFFGSTNRSEFLNDETGTVRWLCFKITSINWNYKIDCDINLVWGQAYALYKSNFESNLSRDEILQNEQRNAEFKTLSTELELIQQYFTLDPKRLDVNFRTSTDILREIEKFIAPSKITLNNVQIGKAMQRLGFDKIAFKEKKGYYLMNKSNVLSEVSEQDKTLVDTIPY